MRVLKNNFLRPYMYEPLKQTNELLERVREAKRLLSLSDREKQIVDLENSMTEPDFWQKPEAAKVAQELAGLQAEIKVWQDLEKEILDLQEMAEADAADPTVSLRPEIEAKLKELLGEFTKYEFTLMFSGAHD